MYSYHVTGIGEPEPKDESVLDSAMEMLFANVKPNIVYSAKRKVPLPRADEDGRFAKGNMLCMLTKSQADTFNVLHDDYLEWWRGGYKWYVTDTIFKGKIGRKRIYLNNTAPAKRAFSAQNFPHPLRYMNPANRDSQLGRDPNVILDLGEWTRMYFQYAFKVSIPVIVQKYVTFLAEKINAPDFQNYQTRLVYIPLEQWFRDSGRILSFRRSGLDNPLSILLFACYRYETILAQIPRGTQFIFADIEHDQFMLLPIEFMTKRNFQKIKARVMQMRAFRWDTESERLLDTQFSPEEEDEDSDLNNDMQAINYPDHRNIIKKPNPNDREAMAKYHLMVANRNRLINDAKRRLVGEDIPEAPDEEGLPVATSETGKAKETKPKKIKVGHKKPAEPIIVSIDQKETLIGQTVKDTAKPFDLTKSPEVYDDDDIKLSADDEPITIDDDSDFDELVVDGVDEAIAEMQKENPDILLNEDGELSADKVTASVQRSIKRAFMPELTEDQKKLAKTLGLKQSSVIVRPTTLQKAKSKVIKDRSFDKAVDTTNKAITTSRFINFDKSYNEQKMAEDIDSAVMALSKAASPVFVVDKQELDTSDQLNLKKEIVYTLKDIHGGTHTVKIEVPIVIEDNYVYINGSKICLGHQTILRPIVKTSPKDVQICSWFSKMTVRRKGYRDPRAVAIKSFMEREPGVYDIHPGNALNKNTAAKRPTNLDIDIYAKSFVSFMVGNDHFILDQAMLEEKIKAIDPKIKLKTSGDSIPVGYNRGKKEVIYVTSESSLTDIILERMSDIDRAKIAKMTKNSAQRILQSRVKVQGRFIPLVMLLYFYEGFAKVMEKADINYHFIDKTPDMVLDYNKEKFAIIELNDSYIIWERDPVWNSMLMNGFAGINLSDFTREDMEDKETWANLISNYFTSKTVTTNLMQFYDFMIDPVTEEILEDYGYPTDLVSLLLVANRMLADNSSVSISSAEATRLRSNEVIAQMVYKEVTAAYTKFRATEYKAGQGRKKPDRIATKPGGVIKKLITDSPLSNDASDLNPIMTIEQNRSITPKGPSGINKARTMTIGKRAYDPSMLGIQGITTSPDGNVGIKRQLTLEPNVTSVRGYLKSLTPEEVEHASNAQLLTPAELLSPPGVLHDDGPRTAMGYKQSQFMIPVQGSCPVFFGNKVESVLPYHLDNNFTIVAKDSGEVVEISEGLIIVRYKDGTTQAIDTEPKMKKNSAGFFTQTTMESQLTKVGQKFKKDEVIAYDPRAFTKNENDLSASMNIGVPIKVAIIPNYDSYEDASPITTGLSEKFTTRMSMKEGVGIPAQSYVESMVDIGDVVEVDDPLIIYDPSHEDENVTNFINVIRNKLDESLMDSIDKMGMPQVRATHAGTVVNIEVYSSVEPEELSPSLRKIFYKYTDHAERANEILDKHKNHGDMNYYKCGQLIKSAREPIKPDYGGRVKGYKIGVDGKGLVIIFYVEFVDIAKTGDKGAAYTALKFTTSHVIGKGREPYSEYRPDEDIDAIISPLSLIARKTPSIVETMFTNKILIELTRQSLEIYFGKGTKQKSGI